LKIQIKNISFTKKIKMREKDQIYFEIKINEKCPIGSQKASDRTL